MRKTPKSHRRRLYCIRASCRGLALRGYGEEPLRLGRIDLFGDGGDLRRSLIGFTTTLTNAVRWPPLRGASNETKNPRIVEVIAELER
jgi:hypothetical protein